MVVVVRFSLFFFIYFVAYSFLFLSRFFVQIVNKYIYMRIIRKRRRIANMKIYLNPADSRIIYTRKEGRQETLFHLPFNLYGDRVLYMKCFSFLVHAYIFFPLSLLFFSYSPFIIITHLSSFQLNLAFKKNVL